MTHAYDDMLDLPHPTSPRHPRMSRRDRAAMFSPFAALTGHSAAIAETARLTQRRIDLDEDSRAALDETQSLLESLLDRHPQVTVTWFQPDPRKPGGSYITRTDTLKKIDPVTRTLTLSSGPPILLDDVLSLTSPCLPDLPPET